MTTTSEPVTKLPPPADITAEASVLGAILYDQRHVGTLPGALRRESFYSRAHQTIFQAVDELRAERVDVSESTVEAKLRDKKVLPELEGGASYLRKLVDETPVLTAGAFSQLVRVVLDKAAARAAMLLFHRAIAQLHGEVDVRELLAGVERDVQKLSMSTQSGGLRPMADGFRRTLNELRERRSGRGTFGLSTGFRILDTVLRYNPGTLHVVAARPGMGKTSYLAACAESAATRGEEVAIFSLEMSEDSLAARMICTEAGLSVSATDSRALTPEEYARADMACARLASLPIYIDDANKGRPSVADIVARIRRLAADRARRNKKLRLVFVDYAQIVKLNPELLRQRHDIAIGEVSTELKAIAKELDLTVVLLAQINRGVESRSDKRPVVSDLKDSGKLEEDADAITFLYRDEYYHREKSRDPGVAEVIVEKNRSGPTGMVKLAFDGPSTRFSDIGLDPDRPKTDGLPFDRRAFTRQADDE